MVGSYRKRPVTIQATQWTGGQIDALRVMKWINSGGGYALLAADEHNIMIDEYKIMIETLEGVMWARVGDWIIRGVKGEYYPCKPDIFAATYEPTT